MLMGGYKRVFFDKKKSAAALFICFIIFIMLSSQDVFAGLKSGLIYNLDYNFWINMPPDWERVKGPLGGDQVEQLIDPSCNAFVEVYASRMPQEVTLQYICDKWEAEAQGKNIAYVQKRISSEQQEIKGAQAVLRTYEGSVATVEFKSYILFSYHKDMAYVVIGVFPKKLARKYEASVKRAVLSFRLMEP
jgi:hypothetical protein